MLEIDSVSNNCTVLLDGANSPIIKCFFLFNVTVIEGFKNAKLDVSVITTVNANNKVFRVNKFIFLMNRSLVLMSFIKPFNCFCTLRSVREAKELVKSGL